MNNEEKKEFRNEEEIENITLKDLRCLAKYYYQTCGAAGNAIRSYHKFMKYVVPQVFSEQVIRWTCTNKNSSYYNTVHEITFGELCFSPPKYTESNNISLFDRVGEETRFSKVREYIKPGAGSTNFLSNTVTLLTPNIARLRMLSYLLSIYVDIHYTYYRQDENGQRIPGSEEETITPKVFVGEIPVMVRSDYCATKATGVCSMEELDECQNDPGGYFIINGGEKVLIPQERMRFNFPIVTKVIGPDKKKRYSLEIRCIENDFIKSAAINKIWIHYRINKSRPSLLVQIPYLRKQIPLGLLLKAYGIVTDKDVFEMITGIPAEVGYDDLNDEIREALLSIINDSVFIEEILRNRKKKELEQCLQDCTSTEEFLAIQNELNSLRKQPIPNSDIVEEALFQIGFYSNNKIERTNRKVVIHYAKNLVYDDIFSHVGTRKTNPYCIREKGYFLCYLIQKLLDTAIGKREPDDRDNFQHKRVENVCELFTVLLNFYLKKMIKEMWTQLKNFTNDGRPISINAFSIKSKHLSQGFVFHISNGNWSFDYPNRISKSSKTGVSAPLLRTCYAATLSHVGRTNVAVQRDSKLLRPRKLQSSRFMKFCPSESPEGQSIGLIGNLTPMCRLSIGCNPEAFIDIVYKYAKPLYKTTFFERHHWYKIFVNGAWRASIEDPSMLVKELRELKRIGDVDFELGISWNRQERMIELVADEGRPLHPVLVVDQPGNKLRITKKRIRQLKGKELPSLSREGWYGLQLEGCIEYVDSMEEDNLLIAFTPEDLKKNPEKKYTHCEIHPALMYGINASSVPFPDHNPATRNTFQSAMGKQVLGTAFTNQHRRLTNVTCLMYPQKPLVSSKFADYWGLNELPSAQEAIVAIMSGASGYHQEDALIVNRASIERGFGRCMQYRIESEIERKTRNYYVEEFCKPDPKTTYGKKFRANYDTLDDEDGLVKVGIKVDKNDALIGKTSPLYEQKGNFPDYARSYDLTLINKRPDAVVDKVVLTRHNDQTLARVQTRQLKIPEVGDKFTSRHGQKGVIGHLEDAENMPFSPVTGMIPDIIINSHAIPSRMTVGQIIEAVAGKVAAMKGKRIDATPFENFSIEELKKELLACRFQSEGNEVLYDGITGKRFKSAIFIGPTYYQRLKHMVSEKIHSRAHGPVHVLTHQPVEGRARDGGFREGEMEREAYEGHGAAITINSFTVLSDQTSVVICNRCKNIAYKNRKTNLYSCRNCGNSLNKLSTTTTYNENTDSEFYETTMPYALKLLGDELKSMGINIKYKK